MVDVRIFDDFTVQMATSVQTVHNSFPGYWVEEWGAVKFLYQRIVERPKATLIDIGAHVGVYSLLTVFCKNLFVYAVEPLESARTTLLENIFLNNVPDQVRILDRAVSDTDERKIFIHDEGTTQHSCINPEEDYKLEQPRFWTECATLDMMCEQHDIYKVDFIKIDAEGYEYKILMGAEKTLEKHHPGLLVECDQHAQGRYDTNFGMIDQYLGGFGYAYKRRLNGADWYFSTEEIP